MSPQLRIVSLATVLVLVAAAAVANIASGSSVRTVHVITGAQHLETLDFPPKGKSPGDVYVFDAPVLSANGRTVIGRIRGTQTAIKRERGLLTVQGMLTYELGSGNQIVIGGLGAYPLSG